MATTEALLASLGSVFVTIVGHDSGCTSYGVDDGRRRWFVKAAYGDDTEQLHSATRFHTLVRHPAIVPLTEVRELDGGLAVIYPWIDGEVLNDPYAPGARPAREPESGLSCFRRLPVAAIRSVLDVIFDAHLEVARRGFVAVDFYDGCVMYDFAAGAVRLVDLDMYRPGPYVLDTDRQYGSTHFMAPEESRRGATIDERTTVFTLGRTARVLLGVEEAWRGPSSLAHVVDRATKLDPAERYPSVAAMVTGWRETENPWITTPERADDHPETRGSSPQNPRMTTPEPADDRGVRPRGRLG